MPVSLLATKFYIPHAQPDAIARPRLTDKLLSLPLRPGSFALLSGPAGFGKTTLLSEFIAQLDLPVAWLSLDEGDNDPVRFWSYVIAACQSVRAGLGDSVLTTIQASQPPSPETIPTLLINDLIKMDGNLVLILDDFHTVQNQAIHTAFAFLLEHLPDNLHIVLSTRSDPPWPLAHFRARNQLLEIRTLELRFTSAEAAAFLNQKMGPCLSAEDITALEARTEGWIAGLQLAAIAMQSPPTMNGRRDIASFVKAFTGSHIYVAEYLVEEVLSQQAENVQTFLLQTSVLERLNANLCQAITGCQGGQAILTALHRANLFLVPLDDEGHWFRYHHLFADLLQARLRQVSTREDLAGLHTRAAVWFEQAGMPGEAIAHALAATDFPTAVRLIEEYTVEMLAQGYAKTVDSWLNAIPAELRFQSPRINMAFVWMHLIRGTFTDVTPHVERLQAIFSRHQEVVDPSLRAEWLAIQSYLQNTQGNSVESMDLAKQALDIAPESDAYVRSLIYNALGMAYLMRDEYTRAVEIYQNAILHGRAAGNIVSEILAISILIQITLQHGQFHLAFETASEGISRVERAGSQSPISAAVYGALGQVYYQWRQLEQAHQYFQRAIQLSAQGGYSDAEIGYPVIVSRLLEIEGDLAASTREIQKAVDRMKIAPPTWTRSEVVSQKVRVYLMLNQLASAERALIEAGFAQDGFSIPDLEQGQSINYAFGQLYNSALRILLHRGMVKHDPANLQHGIKLADGLIAAALRGQFIPIVVEALLLRAKMHAALDDDPAWLTDVDRALELAEPEGFISSFVEEGLPIARALATMLRQNQPGTKQRDYIQKILTAFPESLSPGTPDGKPDPNRPAGAGKAARDEIPSWIELQKPSAENMPIEPLSRRELEVLGLIGEGCSNQEIAKRLVLSLHTVKKHISNIFIKLGVNNRTQAVARARQLVLL